MKNLLTLLHPAPPPPLPIADRALARRAVEAAIWGMPIAGFDAMRQAFLRFGKYGDILYFSQPADWHFQIPTPNASSLYVYLNFNLKQGPTVLDIPASAGAGLFGTILDAWQTPLVDVGQSGEDDGDGGKYLLIPPDVDEIPAGYINVHCDTYNGYALIRAIPATQSDADIESGIALIKKLRTYRLGGVNWSNTQRFIDISGKTFDGIPRYDDSFYDSLARMIDEEPVITRDLAMMGQLQSIGIHKGRSFKPTPHVRSALIDSIAEVHAGFMQSARDLPSYWPGSQWGLLDRFGPQTHFTFQSEDRLAVDERGLTYFLACAPPKQLGATLFVACARDSKGEPLSGARLYRLRIPPDPPVRQYWALTVYDLATASFIMNAPNLGVDSYKQNIEKNADGAIDVYLGATPFLQCDSNWIYTGMRGEWFAMFRFYGPRKALFEKTWVLPNIEQV